MVINFYGENLTRDNAHNNLLQLSYSTKTLRNIDFPI